MREQRHCWCWTWAGGVKRFDLDAYPYPDLPSFAYATRAEAEEYGLRTLARKQDEIDRARALMNEQIAVSQPREDRP